jgi:hypothetical protein
MSGVGIDEVAKGMTPIDYVVLVGLLCSSLGIGVYYALCSKQKSTADYLVGGRSMPLVPTAISLLASYISAILILGQFYEHSFVKLCHFAVRPHELSINYGMPFAILMAYQNL